MDRLFGIVVSTSDCHPRGPGFDTRIYPRNFSWSIGSGTGFTQPRKDNWVATWYTVRSSDIRLRELKLGWGISALLTTRPPCTAIWQQPLQSALALLSCSATDLFIYFIRKYGVLFIPSSFLKNSDFRIFFFLSFLRLVLPSPNVGLTPLENYNPNA